MKEEGFIFETVNYGDKVKHVITVPGKNYRGFLWSTEKEEANATLRAQLIHNYEIESNPQFKNLGD